MLGGRTQIGPIGPGAAGQRRAAVESYRTRQPLRTTDRRASAG